ncbi:MAG: ribonuclease Y [Phycisphaeraceae bacterium]|nr:ribonuclease Y [Phycisphaeraceae bacterium]
MEYLVAVAIATLLVGLIVGVFVARFVGVKSISQSKKEAGEIVERAKVDATTAARQIELDAEKKSLEKREQFEQEMEKVRQDIRQQERRAEKRQDTIDRKEDQLLQRENKMEKDEQKLTSRKAQLEQKHEDLDKTIEEQRQKLLDISGLTEDSAKGELLRRVEDESKAEIGKVIRAINEEAEEEAHKRAREITLQAIQRYASETVSEATVRSVEIPSEDMKGRIIGREGRNIRTIEKVTGVDIIVDDTPGVIVVSCFDKVRQAVAVESLERLIKDGRMHPARIESVVEKVQSEINERIIEYGKEAANEAGVRGLHPKIIEAMGKMHFRTSYSQNVLRHSVEVAYLSQIIADQLGLDGALARRCGFLHDIGKAMDHEMEGGHPKIGMEFAARHGEKEPVLNVIGGHHGDIPATSFYTPIIMAADAVSGARPGARRESMERYVQRLEELQNIALSYDGVEEAHAIQAGREVRVMVDAKKVGDDEAYLIASKIAKRVSDEMTFPGEIKVTVLRETRAIEIAR